MKKAANILFLVGAILSIATAVSGILSGVAFIVLGSIPEIKQAIIDGINNGTIQTTEANAEAAAAVFQYTFIASGISVLFCSLFAIPNCFFAFKGRNSNNHVMFILNIVFGVISGVIVNVVGAVFALVKGDTIVDAPAQETKEVEQAE